MTKTIYRCCEWDQTAANQVIPSHSAKSHDFHAHGGIFYRICVFCKSVSIAVYVHFSLSDKKFILLNFAHTFFSSWRFLPAFFMRHSKMHIKIGGWKHSYWHTFSLHIYTLRLRPHVYAHLSHNRLYLREILGLYTIDIWTAVCVFEHWALRTDRMLYENWRSGACARESTSISTIPPIPPLFNNELWLPGKMGHLVTQSLTLWVLRPLFQIASLRFGCVSVPWDRERVLRAMYCRAMQLHDSVIALVEVTWGALVNARII